MLGTKYGGIPSAADGFPCATPGVDTHATRQNQSAALLCRKRYLPTTVAELQAHRAGIRPGDVDGAPRAQGGDGKVGPLSDRGAPIGFDAV